MRIRVLKVKLGGVTIIDQVR